MESVKSLLSFGAASHGFKRAIKRFEYDRQELIKSPVANVSAAPLESDMFEWHCNIVHNGNIYHLILFFPKEYPCISPSAEFVPIGFNFKGGASMSGEKGTKICLSIFSDFADIHSEWKDEKYTGWSPGYTVQTVLLNVISFLCEIETERDRNGRDPYHKMCRKFHCPDCGHTSEKPFPPLNVEANTYRDGEEQVPPESIGDEPELESEEQLQKLASKIIDYLSKEKFPLTKPSSRNELFGYGLQLSGNPKRPSLTSPCEFLTVASFYEMISSLGKAQSIQREKIDFFLPLYITDVHGSMIRGQFEETMKKIAPAVNPSYKSLVDMILKVIPNLMCSTVIQFSKGTIHTSDNSLKGYFALHRLFLWAMDTYPGLQVEVNDRLEKFVSHRRCRNKRACPDIGQWLMLLSVSGKFSWKDVANTYLTESFNRNVMWYLKSDPKLADMNTPMEYRLEQTFHLTKVSRDLLAFQVAFLRIAKPTGMRRGEVLRRYAHNLGFPDKSMVQELKTIFNRIQKDVTRFDHWYRAIDVPVPSRAELFETLKESVNYANSTEGYFFKPN